MAGVICTPAANSLITNNYPPLSFYVVGVVGLMSGDNIFAGRLIALISMLVVAAKSLLLATHDGLRGAHRVPRRCGYVLAFAVTYGGE